VQVFGYPVERFDKVLIDYVMGRTLKPTELTFVPQQASVAAVALSAVADALLIPAAQLDIGVDPDKAPALLERIRRIAARYPDDWSAKVVLATAELRLGDRVQARALIDSLVAEKPDSAPLLLLLGTSQLLDHQAASATLAHADAVRPDDYRILFLRALAEPPGAEAERRALLLRANALAPQVEPVALAAAQAEAEAGDFAAARALLMPVANNPHGGPAAVQARGWLRQLPAAAPVDGTIKAAPPK
jgi:Flp pilus assembly protein TadD